MSHKNNHHQTRSKTTKQRAQKSPSEPFSEEEDCYVTLCVINLIKSRIFCY